MMKTILCERAVHPRRALQPDAQDALGVANSLRQDRGVVMSTLKRDCLCSECKWPMKEGEAFRWSPSTKLVTSRRYGGQKRINTVRPAHLAGRCFARIEVIEQAELDNKIIDEMARMNNCTVAFVIKQLKANKSWEKKR